MKAVYKTNDDGKTMQSSVWPKRSEPGLCMYLIIWSVNSCKGNAISGNMPSNPVNFINTAMLKCFSNYF